MRPVRSPIVCACTRPSLLTRAPCSASAAFAVSSTVPPSATMASWFSTSALKVPASTVMPSRALPPKRSVTLSPAASAAVPRVAAIDPSFDTRLPTSAT